MSLRLSVLFDGKNSKLKASAKDSQKSLNQVKDTAISVAKSVGAAYASYISIGQIVDVTKRYQKLQAQLRTATGSIQAQNQAFDALRQYAKDTGQDVESLIQGFNKLVNLGLDPSKEALHAYGNVAAATGKTTMDFIEAVADASVAEFERLKEFGIKAKNEGDTVTFRFRGVSTTVKNSSEEIQGYLKGLGKDQFGDALANQMNTLEAKINRLGLTWQEFVFNISESGAGDVIGGSINLATEALTELNSLMNSGQLQASAAAWATQFTSATDDVKSGLDSLYLDLDKSSLLVQAFGQEFTNLITGAVKNFPINVTTMIKILGIELANMVNMGSSYGAQFGAVIGAGLAHMVNSAKSYGSAFGQVIGIELANMVRKAGIYIDEFQDKLSFWDDTNDLEGQLKVADDVAQQLSNAAFETAKQQIEAGQQARMGIIDAAFATADSQIEAARQTRMETISEALQQRDESIKIYEEGLAKAQSLRDQYEQKNSQKSEFDLGQFNTGGGEDPAANDATGGSAEFQKLSEKYAIGEELTRLHYQREIDIIREAVEQKKITELEGFALMEKAQAQHNAKTEAMSRAKANLALTGAQQIFGGIAGIVKEFGGEQSKAYKVMFAVQKGFAIAQGVLNLSTAISQASVLPFPTNIPAMAQAAAAGTQLVSTIRSASYEGQAHDGLARVPASNEGTYMLRRDEMVLNPKQRENFDAMAQEYKENGGNSGSKNGNVVNITNNINVAAEGAESGVETKIEASVEKAMELQNAQLREDFASNGPLSQAFRGVA